MPVATNTKQQTPTFTDVISQFRNPIRTFHHNVDDISPEFFLDSIEDRPGFYQMTAQGPGVSPGESIEVEQSGSYLDSLVDDIEYYSEPLDMWMAVLRKKI